MILEKGEKPPRIHDLVDLLHRVAESGWLFDLDLDGAVFLNSVYRSCYPTEEGLLPHGEPSAEETERAISAAQAAVAKLKKLTI